MSMNIPIGGTAGAGGIERVPSVVAMPQPKLDSNPAPKNANIRSAKEVKQAERQGRDVGIGEEQLIVAIERANKAMQGINTSFRFSIHEGTKEIMVKVLDKDSGEIVREIPSEKILDMVAKMWELSGIFIDERR
jgi:flagellar protein FlaG